VMEGRELQVQAAERARKQWAGLKEVVIWRTPLPLRVAIAAAAVGWGALMRRMERPGGF